jgi:hypothetical protein
MNTIKRVLLCVALLAILPSRAQAQIAATLSSGNCPGTGCALIGVQGNGSAAIQITGTWSGTLQFTASLDGVNYSPLNAVATNGSSPVTTTTGNGIYVVSVAGIIQLRVGFTSYASGTASVTVVSVAGGGGGGGGGASGTVTAIQGTGSALHMTCDAGCSGSTAPADETAFTFGTTSQTPIGGVYQTTPTSNALTTGQMGAFQVTANRALFSNLRNAAGTEVGTSSTPLQVSLANTATNSTAVKVDNSAVTQPVSAATLPLPTGASTSAKQPALGTAGSASADVISVQGIASMTALKVDGSAVTQPVSGTVTVTGAATSANQTNASQKTQIVDGSGNVIASTSNNLNVQCANCSGSGASAVDNATVTESSSTFAPVGGEYQTTPGTVTTGHQAMAAITAHRSLEVALFDTSGNFITPSTDATTNTTAQASGPQDFLIGSTAAPTAVTTGNSVGAWGDLNGRTHITGDASMSPILATLSGSNTTTVTQATGTNLHIVCDSGCSSSTAPADEAAFTAGTTSQSPVGGFFQTTATSNALTTGQMGAFQVTANRALFVNPRNSSGTEIGTSANPFFNNVSQIGGTSTVTGGASGLLAVGGPVASGSSNADNPVKIGSVFNTTQPTVTNGQVVDLQATAHGALQVSLFDTSGNFITPSTDATTNTTAQTGGPQDFIIGSSSAPTAVTTGNSVGIWGDHNGRVHVDGDASMSPLLATVSQATGTNLHVVCDSGCSSSTAPADESTFTAGTTSQSPVGGFFQTTATNNALTTGQMGAFQVTAQRALFSNLRNASGTEVGTSANPLFNNVSQIGGTSVVTGGASGLLAVGGAVASGSSNADNPVKLGAVFNTTQPTVTNGQIVDAQATARGAMIVATGTDAFTVAGSGTFTVGQATGTNLHVVCDSGCSSSTAPADESTFTAGTTSQTPVGGFFQTTATNNALTTGQMGAFQVTAQRAIFSNLRNASGTEVGTSATPLQVTGANGSFPISGNLTGNQAVNLAQVTGTTTSVNSGTSDAGTQRVALSYDGVVTLQASQTSGVANATTTRTTTTGLGPYADISVLLNVTNGGAATGTLQLYLQDSCDSGTTWNDLVSSNTFTFGGSAATQQFYISGRLASSATQGSVTATESLAAGSVRQGPWCDRIRVREKVSGVAGSPTGVTYTISAVAKR